MNADTKNTQAPGPAQERTIYASFQLGDEEFALDVRHVQEVLNLPAAIVAMPLGPDFSLGIFNLRGTIIPLLGMDRLLGSQRPTRPDAKVVIVHHRGIRLGLTCDDTCRVLRPQGDELTLFAYEDRSSHGVVAGVLKLADALVRVLDLNRLITLENVPHPQDALSTNAVVKAKLARKKCITFTVGAVRMAFPIGRIHEIVLVKGLEPSPVKDPLCEGVMHIRQNVVPVVRFASLLGCDAHAEQGTADEQVIVLEVGQTHIGLLIDTVESIDTYTDDQVMTVPVLSSRRAGMFAGCIDFGERGHVFLLDDQGVFESGDVSRITGQHSALFTTGKQTTLLSQRSVASRVPFLRFKTGNGQEFALPMCEVREIVDCSSGIIDIPGAPDHISGMLNVRGKLVTVVDVRQFYHLSADPQAASAGDKVLVLDRGDTLIGLRVDAIESVSHVYPEDRLPVPQIMRCSLTAAIRNDVSEVIQVHDRGEQKVCLLVLEVARVLAAVTAEEDEPAHV